MDRLRYFFLRTRFWLLLGLVSTATTLVILFMVIQTTGTDPSSPSASTLTPGTATTTSTGPDLSNGGEPQLADDGRRVIVLPSLPEPPSGAPTPASTTVPLVLDDAAAPAETSGVVYKLAAPARAEVLALASRLGISGEPTKNAAGEWQKDGLLVLPSGSFSYTAPSTTPQTTPCTVGSTCTPAAPASDLPDDAAARAAFQRIIADAPLASDLVVSRTPFAVVVAAEYVIAGKPTGLLATATFPTSGAPAAVNGMLLRTEKVGEYPLQAPPAALGTASQVLRRSASACGATTSCKVSRVTPALHLIVDRSGTSWLIPAYELLDTTGGRWSVPALQAKHLLSTTP